MPDFASLAAGRLDFDATPLCGNIGAEVVGLDLRSIDADTIARVRSLVSQCCVVVFRAQHLVEDELGTFGRLLGPLTYTAGLYRNSPNADVYRVHNPGKAKAKTETWHSDSIYSERSAAYTVLAAHVLPPVGGDTLFVNQYLSYDTLSEAYRRLLRGLTVRHTISDPDFAATVSSAVHPIVRVHPLTGRRALFINAPRARELVGFTPAEGAPILDWLYQHSIAIDRMYRHRWRPGDVVIWDNRCTLHAGAHDYGDAERVLLRVMTEGEPPCDGPYDD